MSDERFILNEDKAIRDLLNDIHVSDDKNPNRKVGVWFGQPDVEVQNQSYPYITIDLIDVREATERAMRGLTELRYYPDGGWEKRVALPYKTSYPIPYDLDYQITTYARQPRHDRALIRVLLQEKFGSRMHSLYIPGDDTSRSMFLMGQQKRDKTEDNRRLFSNAYTVRVYSELLPEAIGNLGAAGYPVNTVNITYPYNPEN
jgi:peptidoglycan/xylan/chitin deacetylase (PgdA/CDA1 family)